MKKCFIFLLVAVIFVACGGNETQTTFETQTPEQTEQTIPETQTPEQTAPEQQIPEQTEQTAPEPQTSFEIGGTISFGEYDWRVLDTDGDYALILMENVIGDMAYHDTQDFVTWETSDARRYLNEDFYNNFSPEERARVRETNVVNDNNPWFGINGGNSTTDKIFSLSIEEVVKYFGDSGLLEQGKNEDNRDASEERDPDTGDIINHGIFEWGLQDQYGDERISYNSDGSASWWWLRSPGINPDTAAIVDVDGYLNFYGIYVNNSLSSGGLRPALWLNLES
jgi:hypothetical protein